MHALDVGFDKGFAEASLKGCEIKPGKPNIVAQYNICRSTDTQNIEEDRLKSGLFVYLKSALIR